MGIHSMQLPQLNGKTCIADGGLETYLIFLEGIDIPQFAAYDLLRTEDGYSVLYNYFTNYAALAKKYEMGAVLETPTYRASSAWAEKIGDPPEALADFNRKSVSLLEQVRTEYQTDSAPIVVSGNVGPRGDGYSPDHLMSVEEARDYHRGQIAVFAETNADMITALTLNYIDEAIGIVKAAQEFDLPICISFTVETDGRLPTGDSLEQAIKAVDDATDCAPAYYMINCAHPTHFAHLFEKGGEWLERIKGIRGNASCLSHAELDECEELDEGNPSQFGQESKLLKEISPHLQVFGGCCGTDHRHIEEICLSLRQ